MSASKQAVAAGGVLWWLRQLHLYVGLSFGAIFVVSGLTGSAIAWRDEIDSFLNPDLFHSAPAAVTPARAQAVIDRLAADANYGRPSQLMLPTQAGEVYVAWYRQPKASDAPWSAEVSRQVMVDAATLEVKGERHWGEFGLSRRLLMPTLFHLHRYLLAGEWGKTVIGLSGLALMLTSLAGMALWWPQAHRQPWRRALRVSYGGSWKRLAYTGHRAAGVITLPVLAFLGFSGLYFNLPNWVVPVVASLAEVSPAAPPSKPTSQRAPTAAITSITPAQAMEIAQARFPQGRISRLLLPAKPTAPYEIRLRQPDEIRQGDGATRIRIEAASGQVTRVVDPLQAPAGDKFLGWLFPLHSGEAFGTPGRLFVTAFGLMPPLFFVTGLLIWTARQRRHRTLARAA